MPSRTVAAISGCEWPSIALIWARGEVQHAPARIIVQERTAGTDRHEVDELAAIFEQVTLSACPKLRIRRHDTLVHSFPLLDALRYRSAAELSATWRGQPAHEKDAIPPRRRG